MSNAFKNPVPYWIRTGVMVMHEGESLRLGTCLELPFLDESDVAAALLFHAWRRPQEFWDAVMTEYRRRFDETAHIRTRIAEFDLADIGNLKALAGELAAKAHRVSVTLDVHDGDGVRETYRTSLDAIFAGLDELTAAADAHGTDRPEIDRRNGEETVKTRTELPPAFNEPADGSAKPDHGES